MKNLSINFLLLMGMVFIIGCNPEKQPINYGKDNCDYCNMTIVDKRYGSEVVTNKGKVYKFDAVECMINFLNEGNKVKSSEVAMKLVNTYDQKGKLSKASECYYLRSKELPSPMGMYITPFTNEKAAKSVQGEKGGKLYDWEKLNSEFENFSRNMKKGA